VTIAHTWRSEIHGKMCQILIQSQLTSEDRTKMSKEINHFFHNYVVRKLHLATIKVVQKAKLIP